MTGEVSERTFSSWRRFFEVAGYTAMDLEDATNHLAANGCPSFHGEQLAAITRFMRERRSIVAKAEAESVNDHGSCTKCGGSGRVVVPHLEGVRNGKWLPTQHARGGPCYYTMAVVCHCALGRWFYERSGPDKRPMGVEQYTSLNPQWPQQWRQRMAEKTAECEATGVSPRAEEVYQLLVAVLDHRMRQVMGEA